MKKTQSGFALIWMTILLPVALLAVCSLFCFYAWLSPEEQSLHICRSTLLQELPHFSEGLQTFLSLNDEVLALRLARVQAEAELAAAMAAYNPPAIALAQEQLQLVIQEQQDLKAEQSLFQENLNLELQRIHWLTEQKISASQNHWGRQVKDHFSFSGATEFSAAPRLAVKAVAGPDDGPPIYELSDNFTESQALHISWKQQIKSHMKGELEWPLPALSQKNGCSASLRPTAEKFQPVLIVDKFSLSSCSWCH